MAFEKGPAEGPKEKTPEAPPSVFRDRVSSSIEGQATAAQQAGARVTQDRDDFPVFETSPEETREQAELLGIRNPDRATEADVARHFDSGKRVIDRFGEEQRIPPENRPSPYDAGARENFAKNYAHFMDAEDRNYTWPEIEAAVPPSRPERHVSR